jgi:NAD(P)H-hydrate epimerase
MTLKVGDDDLKLCLPQLDERVNKGDMGRVLAVCGSYDKDGLSMCGAAYFSAAAAYRTGAGIVEIFTARENYTSLAALVPEAVFSLYGDDESESEITARLAYSARKADAVIIGCGLGKSVISKALLRSALESIDCPLLIDADGLNILSENEDLWQLLSAEQRRQTVITPHIGEMSRLCGRNISDILDNTVNTAVEFANEKGIVCLLKDHRTVISDGERVYVNQTGNAGMATAGMGDLLAGIVGALLARRTGDGILRKVAVGAYLHGRAGDLAAKRIGEYSLISSDLLTEIGAAARELFE